MLSFWSVFAPRVAGLLAGQLDLATYSPPQLWKSVEQRRRVRLSTSIGGRMVVVVFHLDKDMLLVIGYLAGLLGDRVIQEIYRREQDIYTFFVGDRIKRELKDND